MKIEYKIFRNKVTILMICFFILIISSGVYDYSVHGIGTVSIYETFENEVDMFISYCFVFGVVICGFGIAYYIHKETKTYMKH